MEGLGDGLSDELSDAFGIDLDVLDTGDGCEAGEGGNVVGLVRCIHGEAGEGHGVHGDGFEAGEGEKVVGLVRGVHGDPGEGGKVVGLVRNYRFYSKAANFKQQVCYWQVGVS